MGKPKPAVTTTVGTTDQKYDTRQTTDQTGKEHGTAIGANIGQETGGGSQVGTGHTETTAERQQREQAEAIARSKGTSITGTTGTTKSDQTTTGRTDTTSRTGGSSKNEYGWAFRPDTEDTTAFRKAISEYQGVQDPTISFNAANQREQVLRMAQNPLGAYTTPESRQAITQNALSQIGQQEGQGYLQDAYNRSQQKLQAMGLQGQLAQMTQPMRELLGTQQEQEQTGTGTTVGGTTGTTTADQTARTDTSQENITNTISNLFSTDKATSDQMTTQISDFFKNSLGLNFGETDSESEQHGVNTGQGTSTTNQNGTTTYTPERPNPWTQVLGGAANAAAII